MEELINSIIEREWVLFQNVNGDDRVSCQNNRATFEIMRKAQYRAWSQEALSLYSEDLDNAAESGYSIVREKYIRMMRSTSPQEYEEFSSELPDISPEKTELVKRIWSILSVQTEQMRTQYPFVASGGRPLYAKDEMCGWPSVETYQTSELLTYSEKTLKSLLTHIESLEKENKSFAKMVQENTMRGLGFSDMDTAEHLMATRSTIAAK